MAARRLLFCGLAMAVLGETACAPCNHGEGFELSLARDTGGQASPIASAEWFARHGGVWSDAPSTGWRVVGRGSRGVDVQSGPMTLQAWQGPDGSWFVVSGSDAAC